MLIKPRNWGEFQHYKNRLPPWVKLHKTLLDDRDYQRLPVASRALAPMLWLLASESEDGVFDASIDELTFRLRQNAKEIEAGIKPLIEMGFFTLEQVASNALADCQQLAVPEKRRQETETEASFDVFYKAYPRKVSRKSAFKAFKAEKADAAIAIILADIQRRMSSGDWSLKKIQFIPYPASYLHGRLWEDEPESMTLATSAAPWAGAR